MPIYCDFQQSSLTCWYLISQLESMQEDEKPELKKRFPVLLRSAWFGLNKTFRRRLKEHGLTPAQFISLRWLVESPPGTLSQMDLSRLTASNANNVADLVARMEDEGLLDRVPGKEDARAKMLFLTDSGRCSYERARVTAVALQTEILSGLDHGDRETFLELLERVGESLEDLATESSCHPPATQ